MAIENAKQFVEKVKADVALNERLKGKKPEECLALAKEMGLEFTEEELKAALSVEELSLEDMDKVAGGSLRKKKYYAWAQRCPANGDNDHVWVKTGHREDYSTFLWIEYSDGWDIYTCSLCGKTKEVHT